MVHLQIYLLAHTLLPVLAERKPNGKLRILVDLRQKNHLTKHDYN